MLRDTFCNPKEENSHPFDCLILMYNNTSIDNYDWWAHYILIHTTHICYMQKTMYNVI